MLSPPTAAQGEQRVFPDTTSVGIDFTSMRIIPKVGVAAIRPREWYHRRVMAVEYGVSRKKLRWRIMLSVAGRTVCGRASWAASKAAGCKTVSG